MPLTLLVRDVHAQPRYTAQARLDWINEHLRAGHALRVLGPRLDLEIAPPSRHRRSARLKVSGACLLLRAPNARAFVCIDECLLRACGMPPWLCGHPVTAALPTARCSDFGAA